jgi:hypothetical protein
MPGGRLAGQGEIASARCQVSRRVTTLTIDGHLAPVPVSGTRQIPIMSGRHHLQVHSQWMRRYGHAAIDIDVVPGQSLEVFYAPPYHQFSNDGWRRCRRATNGCGGSKT